MPQYKTLSQGELEGQTVDQARGFFPRGLIQPAGRFRFSIDALLLAAFSPQRPAAKKVVDLGAGCGVVGLGLALRRLDLPLDSLKVLALDKDPDMVAAATANAAILGLAEHFDAIEFDLRHLEHLAAAKNLRAESMDLALANPPYRRPNQGRRPPEAARTRALFEVEGELDDFIVAARYLLRPKASLCLVHLAERLGHVLARLSHAGLEPKRLLPVHSHADQPARRVLIEARKAASAGLVLEPGLTLYQGRGPDTRLSDCALAFCPFLACDLVRRATLAQTQDSDPDAQTTRA